MNNDEHDAYRIFRRIGSTGLVIFERDGILLKQHRPSKDFMLGDISNEFVEMLTHLRELDVRFGFISDDRGMDGGTHGKSAFTSLARLLDGLLDIRGAAPDFWIAWRDRPERKGTHRRHRVDRRLAPSADMIRHAIEWYRVDKHRTVFVYATAAGLVAANDADIINMRYVGVRSERIPLPQMTIEIHPPQLEISEIERLRGQIERILGLDRRRRA